MTNKEKCITDIHEFMKNYKFGYNKIKNKFEVFEYYNFEKEVVNLINDNRYSIILKGRQVFMTTILATYTAWSMLNGKGVGVYTNRRDISNNFLDKVKLILSEYGVEFETNRKGYFELKGGGSVKGLCTPTGFCSHSFDELIIDEAAFIYELDKVLSVGLPTLATGGKVIMASTPNGLEGFYDIWQGSKLGDNPYKEIKVTFEDVPFCNEKWLEDIRRGMNNNERMIRQELYAEFLPPIKVKKHKKTLDSIVNFRVSEDLMNKLSRQLIKEDVSISKYLRNLILKDVNK